jgi:hypothetical protein
MDLSVNTKELSALQCLADHGGSLPGSILAAHCFSSSTACTKTMNHLAKICLVEKGRYTCYFPKLTSNLYYVLRRDALGLVTGQVWAQWLEEAGLQRFNLAAQETQFLYEKNGWQWIDTHREILMRLKEHGIVWGRIDSQWPLLVFQKPPILQCVWLFWQGLEEGEMAVWERITRDLRLKNLLVGISLRKAVADDIRRRFLKRNIHCPLLSLENFPLSVDT